MSLIGDGLSHLSFGAIALGLSLGIYPFYVAIPLAIIGAYFIVKISEKASVYGDAAIGIVSAVGIAGGVLLASISNGFNVDLFSYLFGSILSISMTEVWISIALSAIVFGVIYVYFQELTSATFDEEYAKASGIKTDAMNLMLVILTAISVVLSVKIVGIMLVSALLILPAVTALQIAKSFGKAIFLAALVSVFSVISGIVISFFLDLPSGATIVMINFILFLLTIVRKINY
jgi:zinc transport system permease protein